MCFSLGGNDDGHNEFKVTVLADGTVKVLTGSVGDAEHFDAERFVAWLEKELATKAHREARHAHEHAHHHRHDEVKL